MALAFGQVEQMLRHLHHIAESKHGAFRARLKHLQRLGFPAGGNTGKGKAAAYGAAEILSMALAVDLIQLGLSPERVVQVLEDNEHWYASPVSMIIFGRARRDDPPMDMFLFFDPSTLDSLSDHRVTSEDMASASFNFAGTGQLRENIQEWSGAQGVFRRLSIINLSSLIRDVAAYCSEAGLMTEDALFEGLREWSDPIVHGVGDGDDQKA